MPVGKKTLLQKLGSTLNKGFSKKRGSIQGIQAICNFTFYPSDHTTQKFPVRQADSDRKMLRKFSKLK
jgi:hypothetical protein